MRRFLKALPFITLLLSLLGVSSEALATCTGPAGIPFNCTAAVNGPSYNDLVLGGVTSGAQNGQTVRWTWGQILTGTTLTSPVIINGTINSLNAPLAGLYGGTGVANSGETITIGGNILTHGNFTLTGAYPLAFTLTGATAITLPTSGTLFSNALTNTDIFVGNASNVATGVALTGDCAITNAGVLTCTKINGKTVSLANTLTTTGGTLTFTLSGNTTIAFPASGTLLTVVPNYLTGVTLSNDSGTPNSKLDIAAGVAADSTNAQMITIGAFVKSTAGAWVSGTGNDGMGNGLTIADSTWYHVCLAYNGGTPDVWFDTSAVCANVPSGLSGTLFRRIGSFETNSSAQIFAFNQTGDRFDRALPVLEYQGTPGVTTAASLSFSGVPTGVVVTAILSGYIIDPTGENSGLYISSLAQTDTAASGVLAITGIIGSAPSAEALAGFSGFTVVTNTSAAVRRRVNSTTASIYIITNGWIDSRGK